MEHKIIVTDYLDSVFLNLSNVAYKVVDVYDDTIVIKIIKKNNCFYKYDEIKAILNGSFIHEKENKFYNILLETVKSNGTEGEYKVNYKIEECEE